MFDIERRFPDCYAAICPRSRLGGCNELMIELSVHDYVLFLIGDHGGGGH